MSDEAKREEWLAIAPWDALYPEEQAKRAYAVLAEIRDRDWVENALDPQWATQTAKRALEGSSAENCGEGRA